MEPAVKRAKAVLDICAFELRGMNVGDLATLEAAIIAQIEDALREQMRKLNRERIPG